MGFAPLHPSYALTPVRFRARSSPGGQSSEKVAKASQSLELYPKSGPETVSKIKMFSRTDNENFAF